MMTNKEKEQALARDLLVRKRFFRVWMLVGAILLAGVIVYVMQVLATPVGIIAWTAIIVFTLRGPVNGLEKRGVNRAVGTAIAYVLMFVVLLAMGALLFSPVFGIGDQFINLIESVPGYVQQIIDWYNQMQSQYAAFFQNDIVKGVLNDISSSVGSWASDAAKVSADGLLAVGTSVANSFMIIGFAFVVGFWILMQLPAIGRETWRLIGERRREDAQMLYVTFTRVMGGYLKATIVQCTLIGIFCAIAYALIGIPNYAAIGGIAGLLNIIPVVGPWIGGALAAILGIFVSPWAAIIALVVTIVIQQFVYTFISPKLMANSVDVHPALVILALLAGSAIGGAMSGLIGSLVGMLASIPAVAAAKAIFVYYFEKRTGRQLVAEDGVFFKGAPSEGEGGSFDLIADAASTHRVSKGVAKGRQRLHKVTHWKKKRADHGKEADGVKDKNAADAPEKEPAAKPTGKDADAQEKAADAKGSAATTGKIPSAPPEHAPDDTSD